MQQTNRGNYNSTETFSIALANTLFCNVDMAKITIKELAKHLNLSISTVSRALNDSHEIKTATKQKVKEMAIQLGYTPDVYASNLRSRKSKTIGIIIPEITNSFFSQVINGIQDVAMENGYHVLIYLTHENYEQEVAVARLLLDGRVDGVLISVSDSTSNGAHLDEFRERNIPVILFDRIFDQFQTLKITTDDFESGLHAAQLLIKKGCKHLSYLSFSPNLSIDQRRKTGFVKAAEKAGIQYSIVPLDKSNANREDVLTGVLGGEDAPDGIFSPVESLGLLVYEVCYKLNKRIPEDVKVLSFSNLKIAAMLNPPLTTITQPALEIGRYACTALFKAMRNNFLYDDEELIMPSILIERQSTEGNG